MTLAREIARYALAAGIADIPDDVQHAARRSLLNWAGCAVGGSRQAAVENALAALAPFSAGPHCSVFGRSERMDALNAALVNGMSAHVLDFDDTHLRTLLHPSAPVASALIALAEREVMSGRDFLPAFIVGVEIECRIANAIAFAHNSHWYITGTAGTFGAAAASARALGLSAEQTVNALGLAAAQAAGTREMAGTMAKSFIHGRAGQNGLLAALLAQQGFTAADTALEGPHGFLNVLAPARDLAAVTAGLGATYEILQNSFKPYACGVVAHPVIEACIRLRNAHGLRAEAIERIALTVNPRALELTGIESPASGLKSKWSVYHSAAVAIVDGAAGEHQYTDARVADPEVSALCARVQAAADPALAETAARVAVTLRGGGTLSEHVTRVAGSAENPMSDRDLEDKVRGLAHGILPPQRTAALIAACWAVAELDDAAGLARAATPG